MGFKPDFCDSVHTSFLEDCRRNLAYTDSFRIADVNPGICSDHHKRKNLGHLVGLLMKDVYSGTMSIRIHPQGKVSTKK